MTKILFAGDTHSSISQADYLIRTAIRKDASVIFVVGDWGYMWNDMTLVDDLDSALRSAGAEVSAGKMEMWWIDGNHENFHLMGAHGCDPNNETDTWVAPTIRYLPRGFRFNVDSVSFMTFGGAVSVDRNGPHRIAGRTWFYEETIKEHQVAAVTRQPVDVLVTHDVPEGVPMLDAFISGPSRWPEDALRDSAWNRELLSEVAEKVTPKLVVHGHYHYRYTDQVGSMRVEGLDCNDTGERGWMLFDTEEFNV